MGGPAIGGGLLAIMAPGLVVALAGICAGVVAWLVAGLPRTVETDAHCEKRLRRTDLAAGFITIARVPALAAVAMLSAAGTFVFGALSVLIVAFTLDDLAVGQAAVGVLNGALGAGGIVGGIAAIALAPRRKLALQLQLGIAAWGALLICVALVPTLPLTIVLFVLIGIGSVLVDVSTYTFIQQHAPESVRARIFGALEGTSLVAYQLASNWRSRRVQPRSSMLRRLCQHPLDPLAALL